MALICVLAQLYAGEVEAALPRAELVDEQRRMIELQGAIIAELSARLGLH